MYTTHRVYDMGPWSHGHAMKLVEASWDEAMGLGAETFKIAINWTPGTGSSVRP